MSYLTEVLADSPRHYWRLADPGGLLAFDIGSAPAALLLNGQSPSSSPCLGPVSDGGSWVLQGSAYPWFKDPETIVLPITVEAWVWQQARAASAQVVLGINDTGRVIAVMFIDSTGKVNFQGPPTGASIVSPAAISIQAWHHLVVSISSLGAAVMYVDSVQVQTGSFTPPASNTYVKSIGGQAAASGNPWSGAVGEVAHYGSVLSSGRVAAHYSAADSRTQSPISRQFGTWSSSTGSSTLLTGDLATVLASVRKDYVNAP